jgi:hypothetical protein
VNSAAESKKEGADPHVARLDVLTMMKMSGDSTDRAVSEIVSKMITVVQKERELVIPKERVNFIVRIIRTGIKDAEKEGRLTRREMRTAAERVFIREKLWPP